MSSSQNGALKLRVNSVIDSSALLAVILHESGADVALDVLNEGAFVSAVNLGEVVARLSDLTSTDSQIPELMQSIKCEAVEFDSEDAWRTGLLRRATRSLGLSFGDRACLALGQRLQLPVVTADRIWASLDVGVEIVLCR
jgi:PIN domain nuclease of toxin-antitoxin system